MKKSKLQPTLEDAFGVGKIEGQKEMIKEVLELLDTRISHQTLQAYLKAKLKGLNVSKTDNPFKRGKQ